MAILLLTTKLYIPPQRPNLVLRPRLVARLDEGLHLKHQLTLVSAKAGSGKTTLVSEWLHLQERPATWLSLDPNDDDPRRFFSYLVAALQQLDIDIDQTALNQLETPQLPQAATVAAELINNVAISSIPFLLVIDDYHLIQNEWIHEVIGFLVEHQPPQGHLIILTRVDPPLPLARLRGRGLITEFRDHDMRFTAEEAAKFLNEVMQLDLSADVISVLERRTEGWIAGLQMAAISMQGRTQADDLNAFVDGFGGTNRYVLDYLMDEVLNLQVPAVQDFLIETSILGRMCGDLCDAVRFGDTESPSGSQTSSVRSGKAKPPSGSKATAERIDLVELPGSSVSPKKENHDSQMTLAHLERANLFVTSLDDERRWYRYHHLFADLLKSTLTQRRTADQVRELHRRASRWHQSNGSLEEAMIHALAAQDFERAATMIDENIVGMLTHNEAPVLLGWIGKLPDQVTRGRPWVDICRAYALALSGRPAEADLLVDELERRLDPSAHRSSEFMGHIAAIRSYTANLWGDVDRVIEMAALAAGNLPEEHLIARGMACYALTCTHFASDDMDSAIKTSLKMLEIGKKLDRLLMIVTALCDLASMYKVQGRLRQAQEHYDIARQWLVKRNGMDSRVRCVYEVGWADSLLQWNQLDAAYEHAVTGIEYCQRFEAPSELTWGYVTLMRVLQARGDVEGALDALYDAEQVLRAHYVRQALRVELETRRVALCLAVGDTATASRWADCCTGGSEREQLALARLNLAEGHPIDAQRLLERQLALADAGGRNGRLIEILCLLALAFDAQGRADEANSALSQALSLSRPEGYVRVFLDMGWSLRDMLKRSLETGTVASASPAATARFAVSYVHDLLDAFQCEKETQRNHEAEWVSPAPTLAGALVDALTEREMDVLYLLAKGLSNKEIAARLVVAPSTVKQHLKNMFGKLNVHSRTQAVARARELGLL